MPARWVLDLIRGVLAFQFSDRVARALTSPESEVMVEYSSTGRIRYVWLGGERILTRRAGDGLYALSSLKAGVLVARSEPPPRFRVVVREPEFVGRGVLAVNVAGIDPLLRAGDEVVIVDEDDRVLGVGRLRVPPPLALTLMRGEVVRVRKASGPHGDG